jgi:hypothetical protein
MKRLIALLLFVAFLLISCGEAGNDISQNVESEASVEESEEFVLSAEVEQINGYMTKDIDRSMKVKNLFKNLKYTPSRPADEKYPDPYFEKLTDGQMIDVIYGKNNYAGWYGGGSFSILFDLGSNENAIGDLAVRCARIKDYGIGNPKYITALASNDGEHFTQIGRVYTPSDIEDTAQYTYYFAFPKAVSARYIKFVFGKQDSTYCVIDEISAFEYCEDGSIVNTLGVKCDQTYTIEDFYGYNLNLGESKVKVSPSDSDYNEVRNLATIEGVDFQIQHFEPFFEGHTNSGMEKIGMLTDGKLHGSNVEQDYFIFYRGAGRHVVADLGTIMSVSGSTVSFQDRYSWGMTTPPVYYISVSENGTDWVTVFAEHNPDYGKTMRYNDTRTCDFGGEFRARYVRITFPTVPDNTVSSAVYMGEWEITGKKNPENAKTATLNKDIIYGRYPDPEEFGISDILWTGIADSYGVHCTDYHVLTEQTAYDYMVTTGADGKAEKILFDSFCLTTRGDLSWHANRNEGYSWFLSEVFYEGLNLDAIEAARGRVNEELGIDTKATVWVAVNCPVVGDTFNGKTVTSGADYLNCLKWMADEVIKNFNAKGYKNIELAGFYWQVENLRPNKWSPAVAYDTDAAIAFNKYVHSLGYMSLWLPYYSELKGIWHSLYYGFDITCWQPNYMFSSTIHTRLDTIAELAKIYGVGIEIEVEPNKQSKESLNMYREYLSAGYRHGFMNGINAYYQGPVPGTYVTYRDDKVEINKTIHDESILYIRGELTEDPFKVNVVDLSPFATEHTLTVKNGDDVIVNIGSVENVTYRYETTPMYGTVKLDFNGKLTYSAMKGYKGEDVIKITLFNGENERKTITVKVNVTP